MLDSSGTVGTTIFSNSVKFAVSGRAGAAPCSDQDEVWQATMLQIKFSVRNMDEGMWVRKHTKFNILGAQVSCPFAMTWSRLRFLVEF